MKRLLLLFVLPSFGQIFQKITGSSAGINGRNEGDIFGGAVSISGDIMVVGAAYHDFDSIGGDSIYSAGAVFVYQKVGGDWVLVKKLTGSSAGINGRVYYDIFGVSVSVSGDVAVVGSRLQNYNSVGGDSIRGAGAAYVFHRNKGGTDNWGFVKKLTGEDAGINGRVVADGLGWCASVSGDVIVVGVDGQDYSIAGADKAGSSGAAYIFHRNEGGADNWGFVKKLTGELAGNLGRFSGDYFGTSVSVFGDVLAVGTSDHDYDSSLFSKLDASGAVYIFNRNKGGADNWGFVKKITGSEAGINGRVKGNGFGIAVSVSDGILVVGAYGHSYDSNGANKILSTGAAYVFYQNKGGVDNWGFVKKLTGESAGLNGRVYNDHFGISVAISGDIISVGVPEQDYNDTGGQILGGAGAVYVYYRNKKGEDNWGFMKKLTGTGLGLYGRARDDHFGYSVSIEQNTIVIGAPYHGYDSGWTNYLSGAGAVFVRSFIPLNVDTVSLSVCERFEAQNGVVYTASGEYSDTIINSTGGDSVFVLYLTIKQPSFSTIFPVVCKNYISPQGNIYTVSGTYIDTVVSAMGCDSIITINLTIKQPSYSAISPVACINYTSPQGNIYTTSGTYTDTLTNAVGCDSIITINLTIYNVNKTITQVGTLLIANDTNATNFQWLDCSNNLTTISGQTNRAFTGVLNGSFAVEINIANVCIDTSDCITIKNIGIKPTPKQSVTLYPNPTKDVVTITFTQPVENAYIRIVSINGQTISEKRNVKGTQEKFDLTEMPLGVYFIEVVEKDKITRTKIIKL